MNFARQARILVIDDDEALSSSVRELLETAGGYHVAVENSAQAAMHTAREFRPDLVLLDINMPEMDGAQVAAELRTDPLMRRTRILFLSALVTPGQQGFRDGAYHLAKPVKTAALLQAVGNELVAAEV